nr:site-2 protease family protein [Brevibacillus fulvus]
MILSFGAYALFYGWKFAVALVYLIFVHELGHLIAARQKGIPTSPAIFMPFVGAFISMKEQPRDAKTEAYLAYGGPFAGLLSFLPAIPLYWYTGDPFWILVVSLGATLNLFNLLPISPLDGGRIVSVLSPKIWFFGLLGLAILLIFSPSPMLLLILIFGLISWWNHLREGYQAELLAYERDKLQEILAQLKLWPQMDSFGEVRAQLYFAKQSAASHFHEKRGFTIPLLQDQTKLKREKARLDLQYAELAWNLFQAWERSPIAFNDGDPLQPLPAPVLRQATEQGEEKLQKIETDLQRLTTYYQAPARTKWKVLAAYLGLALVLSVFFLFGTEIMEFHRPALGTS